jgi:hypothetical protein
MNEITILDKLPIVFTKDADWLSLHKTVAKEGGIILLPPDAVLVIPPEEKEQ